MENKEEHKQNTKDASQPRKHWYDRWYKIMLLPPVILLLFSLVYLGFFYAEHNEFIFKDASLAGGTTITIQGDIDSLRLEAALKEKFSDVRVRNINELVSGKVIASIVDSSAEPDELKLEIEKFLGYKLTDKNSSLEFSGPTLGENFYRQLIIAILISFALMSLVIFFLFRTFIPSIAVIFAAFADIIITLALVDYLKISLSAAGIAAFLMLIGYSVDTDILLTTRVLKKREGSVNQRIYGSFKTGMFMTVTALLAVLPAFLIVTGLPDSFRQIFLILTFGLFADIINTWLTNASIIKWYTEKRGIK